MFPHSITIYTLDDEGESYSCETVKGVYWYGNNSLGNTEKGKEKGNSITIVMPLNKQPSTLKNGSIVVKGIHEAITSIKDLESVESVTVSSIAVHDVGSNIDNIVVSCV